MHMRNVVGLTCILGLAFAGVSSGATRYVNVSNATPASPYLTAQSASTNIQLAIDVAVNGDEILVEPGAYRIRESVEVPFNKRLTLRSVERRSAVIDAQRLCRGMRISGSNSLVEGFTIRNGLTENYGGGLYLEAASTVRDCLVVSNQADGAGGIMITASGVLVENSSIQSNRANRFGGGVVFSYATGVVFNCIIGANVASNQGGGVHFQGAGTVSNSWIADNRSESGGGLYMDDGGRLINSIVVGNRATQDGGGLFSVHGGYVAHCTVVSNTAGEIGGGMYHDQSEAWNSIVYYNDANFSPNIRSESSVISNVCTTPGLGGFTFTNSPRFVKMSVRDFRLAPGSPCIDAGANRPAVGTDYLGTVRPLAGLPGSPALYDVGAYEYEPNWDAGYGSIGNGWRRLNWFGDYIPMGGQGWIWHNKHGFFYVWPDASPENVWLFAQDMGWLWTGYAVYPFLYRASDGAWLWYNGATNPRWFRNMTTEQWESRP